jgi:integrase/recombinase XerD
MQMRFKHLVEDRDRHGNVRLYVRVPGRRKVRIRASFGTDEFMAAYNAAVSDHVEAPAQAREAKVGSFRHLCVQYYASPTFKRLDPATQSWRRRALDAIGEKHGHKPVALMTARHVRMLRDERADQPGAANTRLKALRALFAWANEEGECENDPTIGVKKIRYATNEHHTWTREEIEMYKARHPLGTKARLALDLLRFTTGRREDAPILGPQHIKNGRIQFRQKKNEHRNPVDIDIPLHPELAASIAATPSGHLTFLVTEFGRPYSTAGFGNTMRDWCDQANLHHYSAHGLRKATPTQMAENDATPHQIMAVTGHRSLEEVERYTRKAQRRKLADEAMAKLK